MAGLVALVVLAVVVTWRPWDAVPDELRDAEREIDALPGVVDAEVGYEVTGAGHLGAVEARATLTVRLAEGLAPAAAGRTTGLAVDVFDGTQVPGSDLTFDGVRVEAGEPTAFDGFPVPPLSVSAPLDDGGVLDGETSDGARLAARVADAFALRAAGAARVGNDSAEAVGLDGLVPLAELATDRQIPLTVGTVDGAVRYTSPGAPPDVDVLRLAVQAAGRPSVTSVIVHPAAPQGGVAQGAPVHLELQVGASGPTASPASRAVVRWLQDPARAVDDADLSYVVTEPGYAQRVEGRVGTTATTAAPEEPAPHPVPLPDGVQAWPADGTAPDCSGTDLELELSVPDAAAGSRYLAVRARNVSDRPCALEGVPGYVFRNADGDPQADVTTVPAGPGVVPARVVVPAGERAMATLQWAAMSTAHDPDPTTAVEVTAVPGAEPARLVAQVSEGVTAPGEPSGPAELDVLDGAEVRTGPWVQAADGWS